MITQEKVHRLLTDNRMCIFGISLIWIFLRHTFFYNQYSYGVLDPITRIGDIGVDIFMFLSAYGLSFSYNRNRDKKYFYKRRLLRIVPSVVLLLFIFAVVDTLIFDAKIYHCIDPTYWLFSLYSTYWFIGAILLFYMVFPYLYDFLENLQWKIEIVVGGAFFLAFICIVVIKLSHIELLKQLVVYTARIPILIIGILWAMKGIWKQSIVIICLIIALPLVYLLPKDFQRESYSLLTVPLVFYLPLLLEKTPDSIKRIMSYIGICSLEFYLIHIYLMKNNTLGIIEKSVSIQIISVLIVLCIVILLSVIANKIVGQISNHFLRNNAGRF